MKLDRAGARPNEEAFVSRVRLKAVVRVSGPKWESVEATRAPA